MLACISEYCLQVKSKSMLNDLNKGYLRKSSLVLSRRRSTLLNCFFLAGSALGFRHSTSRLRTFSQLKMSSTSTSDVALNLQDVRDRIQQTLEECNDNATRQVRLVAVSKTKPTEILKQAYEVREQKLSI